MSKVIADISMSLDGFITASNQTPDEPLGQGGERLHEWAFEQDGPGQELLAKSIAELGAMIAGRTTFDDSVRWWGADGPTGTARVPVFVVTHQAPADSPAGGVYTFVTDGIESASRQAQAAAVDRDVAMGGADNIQQFLAAEVAGRDAHCCCGVSSALIRRPVPRRSRRPSVPGRQP